MGIGSEVKILPEIYNFLKMVRKLVFSREVWYNYDSEEEWSHIGGREIPACITLIYPYDRAKAMFFVY